MIDIVVKNIHFLFLAYAIFIGVEYQEVSEEKLVSAKDQLEAMESKITKVERDLKEVKQFEDDREKSMERVQQVVDQIKTIQKQLPSEIRDAEVNGKLTEFSRTLKMLNPNPSPSTEVNQNFYISKDYNFDVQGTYLQFLIFYEKLENLAKNGRILNVKYLRMKGSTEGDPRSRFQLLDLTSTVEAYKYNESYDPGGSDG